MRFSFFFCFSPSILAFRFCSYPHHNVATRGEGRTDVIPSSKRRAKSKAGEINRRRMEMKRKTGERIKIGSRIETSESERAASTFCFTFGFLSALLCSFAAAFRVNAKVDGGPSSICHKALYDRRKWYRSGVEITLFIEGEPDGSRQIVMEPNGTRTRQWKPQTMGQSEHTATHNKLTRGDHRNHRVRCILLPATAAAPPPTENAEHFPHFLCFWRRAAESTSRAIVSRQPAIDTTCCLRCMLCMNEHTFDALGHDGNNIVHV